MSKDAAFEVWPENWPAFRLFGKLQTQWRAGASGVYGLDYNILYSHLDRMGLSPTDYDDWEEDIRTMEFAALAAMNEKTE